MAVTRSAPRRYFVYAVQLAPEAARRADHRRLVDDGADVYYVGQTGKSDAARLLDHLCGGNSSSSAVRRWARRLAGHEGPFATREEAEAQERRWAAKIRAWGHVVLGGR